MMVINNKADSPAQMLSDEYNKNSDFQAMNPLHDVGSKLGAAIYDAGEKISSTYTDASEWLSDTFSWGDDSTLDLGSTLPKTEAAPYGVEAAQESAKLAMTNDEYGNMRLEKDPYGNFQASDGTSYEHVGDIHDAEGNFVGEGYMDSDGNYYAYQYGKFVDVGMDDPTDNPF